MATQVQSNKTFTPLFVLQIFSAALIACVGFLTLAFIFVKVRYGWTTDAVETLNYSPVLAVAAAIACLVFSFLIPEFLLDSARRDLMRETPKNRDEDLPFIFVPSIFIRYGLLSVVTIIGVIMAFSGQGLTVFLPFAAISLALMAVYFPTEARLKYWLKARPQSLN